MATPSKSLDFTPLYACIAILLGGNFSFILCTLRMRFTVDSGAILEKPSGGSSYSSVRIGTTPLTYCVRANHAHYITHAQCVARRCGKLSKQSGIKQNTAVKTPRSVVMRALRNCNTVLLAHLLLALTRASILR